MVITPKEDGLQFISPIHSSDGSNQTAHITAIVNQNGPYKLILLFPNILDMFIQNIVRTLILCHSFIFYDNEFPTHSD